MTAAKLLKRWQQRLARLQQTLDQNWHDCRKSGQQEAIHRLRVVLRRSRLYTRLGVSLLGKSKIKPFRDWANQISDALGPVRDSDMALEWLKANQPSVSLGEKIRLHRQKQWHSVRSQLKHGKKIPCVIPNRMGTKKAAKRLDRRLAVSLQDAWSKVNQCTEQLAVCPVEKWHELRREIRRIRYLVELIIPDKQQSSDPLLRRLIGLQEALGEAQNINVTIAAVLPLANDKEKYILQKKLINQRQSRLTKAQKRLITLRKNSTWKKLGISVGAGE